MKEGQHGHPSDSILHTLVAFAITSRSEMQENFSRQGQLWYFDSRAGTTFLHKKQILKVQATQCSN